MTPEYIRLIRRRLESGYYEQHEILRELASRLLEVLQPQRGPNA